MLISDDKPDTCLPVNAGTCTATASAATCARCGSVCEVAAPTDFRGIIRMACRCAYVEIHTVLLNEFELQRELARSMFAAWGERGMVWREAERERSALRRPTRPW